MDIFESINERGNIDFETNDVQSYTNREKIGSILGTKISNFEMRVEFITMGYVKYYL
ncbi:MAG: hypothetical protein ACOYK3_07310 [Flavobacterium sp.]